MDAVLRKIHKAGVKFLVPLTLDETYSTIVHEAIKLVKADHGSILMYYDGELNRVFSTTPILYTYKPRKKGDLYRTFRQNQPYVRTDAEKVAKIHPQLKQLRVESMIHIPIVNRNKSIGIMVFYSRKREHFSKATLDILKLFGDMASLAIKKAQLYERISRALETRDKFISMASHELRTPLTTINGYINLLNNKLSNMGENEARWIKELSWESTRLTELINELLTINRIKNGQLNFEWKKCDVGEIIDRAITNFNFAYPKHKIDYANPVNDESVAVIGDHDKLIQVLNNILDNAAKHSPQEKEIKIDLSLNHKNVILSIIDQGIGIKKQDLTKIFNWYYHPETGRDGMGVGLSLAKYIVDAHRGLLTVKSKPNKGTNVEILLPQASI